MWRSFPEKPMLRGGNRISKSKQKLAIIKDQSLESLNCHVSFICTLQMFWLKYRYRCRYRPRPCHACAQKKYENFFGCRLQPMNIHNLICVPSCSHSMRISSIHLTFAWHSTSSVRLFAKCWVAWPISCSVHRRLACITSHEQKKDTDTYH